ncbi:MAG: hypothetical protein KBS85_08620, partial [Lachnospiraceae bacterium]|nr:hypothetical protein [Candidatus Merdinaster equi]
MRMYAWCMAFVTGAAFSAYDAYETGRIRSFIGLLVCGVAAAYSHYFAFAAILWVHGILFIALLTKLIRGKKKQQKMPSGDADYGQSTSAEQCEEMCKVLPGRQLMFYITTALLSVIAYLPWVPKFLGQIGGVSGSYWIPEITWDVILDYFRWIFASDYPGTVIICQILFGGCIVWLALSIVRNAVVRDAAVRNAVARKRVSSQAENRSQNSATTIYNNSICKNSPAVLALVIPILTIVTGIMLSLLIRPIFIIRYAMPCIPLLCFFAALMLSRLKAEHFVLLIVFLTSLTALDYKTNYRMEYKATDTDRTLEFFAQNLGENDVILYNYRVYDFIYWCYWPQDKMIYIDDLDYSAGYDHIWFIQTVYNTNPNPDALATSGWTMQYMGDYGIEQNEFWLWDIHR